MIKDGLSSDYESKSRWVGSSFLIIGSITVIYALFSVLALNSVIGMALLIAGGIATYGTAKINLTSPISWMKSLHLLLFGLFFLLYPANDTAGIVVCVGRFFLLETILTLVLAYVVQERPTAIFWVVNAVVCAFIAYLSLLGLQNISEAVVGVFVAIALIINGSALLYSGRTIYIRP
ncbi:MAG: hypothetical protein ABFR02_03315 [Campylobacterota bacterium]